jgi:hypothetical protein
LELAFLSHLRAVILRPVLRVLALFDLRHCGNLRAALALFSILSGEDVLTYPVVLLAVGTGTSRRVYVEVNGVLLGARLRRNYPEIFNAGYFGVVGYL